MKKTVALLLIAGLVVSAIGCKKKEEEPKLPAGHPPLEGTMPGAGVQRPVERTINVPKDVQAKWKSVKIIVEDKMTKSSKEYTVAVGSELTVPDTKVAVKVLNFLPHFMMTDKEITSASNEPVMPAARVSVMENGKEIWKGWLFSLQPDAHPFPHDRIALKLAGGVSK